MVIELGSRPPSRRARLIWGSLAIVGVILVIIAVAANRAPAYRPPPLSYSASSAGLKETIIVPSLDTPIPPGKNVIWCGSFQLAWNRLRDDVIREPVRIANIEEICQRLNDGKLTDADLPAGSFYAAAGLTGKGIREKIRADMARQFPDVTPNLPESPLIVLLAYAFLRTNAKFTVPYFERRRPAEFINSLGRSTPVTSFGLFEKSREAEINSRLGEQIEVLYALREPKTVELSEFALDLCTTSQPNRIVLACLKPGASLAAVLADLERKTADWKPPASHRRFGPGDGLTVPNLNWRIDHRFREMEGPDKLLLNLRWRHQGLFLGEARQMIEFRLDRSGAALASEAHVAIATGYGRGFHFTRPFLIVMSKRGAATPFFVMWVDNAELLCKPGR